MMDDNFTLNNTLTISNSGLDIFSTIYSSVGVLGNLIVLCIIIADKFFRKKVYYLLLICCIMNLLLSLQIIYVSISFSDKNISLSVIITLCRIFLFLMYACYGITIMNLSLIAVYRYFSIVNPFSHFYQTYKNQFLITSEIIILIISIAISMPVTFYIEVDAKSEGYCDYANITVSVTIYLICFSVIYFIVPSSIIIILYWRIIVHQRNRIRPGQPSIHDQIDIKKKYKLVKSLISISACYIFLTWPIFTVLFAMAVTQKSLAQIQKENSVLFGLSLFSMTTCENIAVINPFLYFIFDQNIRHRLKYRFKKFVKR